MPLLVDCPYCLGTARNRLTATPCEVCGGTGRVPRPAGSVDCRYCRGEGRDPSGLAPCPVCRGFGHMALAADAAETEPAEGAITAFLADVEGEHRLDRQFGDEELKLLVLESLRLRKEGKTPHGRSALKADAYDFAHDFGVTGKALRLFLDKNGDIDSVNLRLAGILNDLRNTGVVMPSPGQPNGYVLTQRGEQYASEAPDAAKLWAAIKGAEQPVDDHLRQHCLDLLLGGKVDTAVRDATVYLETRVRERAGLGRRVYGRDVAVGAFSPDSGVLKVSDVKSEQLGAQELFAGAIGLFKNPSSHHVKLDYDPVRGRQILALIDALLSVLDQAEKVRRRRKPRAQTKSGNVGSRGD